MRARFTTLSILTCALAAGVVFAVPSLVEEARLLLIVDLLPVDGDPGPSLGRKSLEIAPGTPTAVEWDVPWPAPGAATRLRLEGTGTPGPPGGEHAVSLQVSVSLGGGRAVHSSRSLRIPEGTTRLLDVFSEGSRRLVLALQAERTSRPVIRAGTAVGSRVRFQLEVLRVNLEQSVSLETNRLDTFVGEGVEYAFQRGQGEELESMRIFLKPLRLEGNVVELEVEVTGTLPGNPNRIVLSRHEHLLTTRGASSSFSVTAGEAPSGYRFILTPDF